MGEDLIRKIEKIIDLGDTIIYLYGVITDNWYKHQRKKIHQYEKYLRIVVTKLNENGIGRSIEIELKNRAVKELIKALKELEYKDEEVEELKNDE